MKYILKTKNNKSGSNFTEIELSNIKPESLVTVQIEKLDSVFAVGNGTSLCHQKIDAI